jgi:hypothetical protein
VDDQESLEGIENEAVSGTQQEPGSPEPNAVASQRLLSMLTEELCDGTDPFEKDGPIPTKEELHDMSPDALCRLRHARPELGPAIRSAVEFRAMWGSDEVEVVPSSSEPDPYGILARFDNGPTSAQMDTEAWQVRHGRRPR